MPREPLPQNLLKNSGNKAPTGRNVPEIDSTRALRTIRTLGAVNLMLLTALAGTIWWYSRAAEALRINDTVWQDVQPVRIVMESNLSAGGKPVRNGDIIREPMVTVQGILADYALLREGLPDLYVTVRGTRMDLLPETGEFKERIPLRPGKNRIDFGIWWGGQQRELRHVEVTYLRPTDTEPSSTP
jgi:hypothetical protein